MSGVIGDLGDTWHLLPLIKCFEIPDAVDPSLIYSDKSHPIKRDELKSFLFKNKTKPIPSPKVLLKEPATNWPEFLKRVNDFGLDHYELIIGLHYPGRSKRE